VSIWPNTTPASTLSPSSISNSRIFPLNSDETRISVASKTPEASCSEPDLVQDGRLKDIRMKIVTATQKVIFNHIFNYFSGT
jgi:hypothetical protein